MAGRASVEGLCRALEASLPRSAQLNGSDGLSIGLADACVPENLGVVLDRDPAFWVEVASHPAVAHTLGGFSPEVIGFAVANPHVLPFRAEHGGFLLLKADSFGRVYELHTLFTPEGWGKEAYSAAKSLFDKAFCFCDLIITHETEHPQSRPPKTFRFKPLGEFEDAETGKVRLWSLSRADWLTSPARSH